MFDSLKPCHFGNQTAELISKKLKYLNIIRSSDSIFYFLLVNVSNCFEVVGFVFKQKGRYLLKDIVVC